MLYYIILYYIILYYIILYYIILYYIILYYIILYYIIIQQMWRCVNGKWLTKWCHWRVNVEALPLISTIFPHNFLWWYRKYFLSSIVCRKLWPITDVSKGAFFSPLGIQSTPDRMQFASDLASDFGSEGTFSLQTDPADARSGGRAIRRTRDPADARSGGRTILLSYFGVNQRCQICVSRNGNHVLLRILKNPSAIQLFHYRLLLFPLQLHIVSQVSIAAKWNKFFLIEATFLLDWP